MKNKKMLVGISSTLAVVGMGWFGGQYFTPKTEPVKEVQSIPVVNDIPSIEKEIVVSSMTSVTPVQAKAPHRNKVYLHCKDKRYPMVEIESQILVIHPEWYLSQRHDGNEYQLFVALKSDGRTTVITQFYKPVLCRFL